MTNTLNERLQAVATGIDDTLDALVEQLGQLHEIAIEYQPITEVRTPDSGPPRLFPAQPVAGIHRGELPRIAAEALLQRLIDAGLAQWVPQHLLSMPVLYSVPSVREAIDKAISRVELYGGVL